MTQVEVDLILNLMLQTIAVCSFVGFIFGYAMHDFIFHWLDVAFRFLRRRTFRASRIQK